MRIFNKLVFSKKEPSNKNDIWFDGKDWKVFIDGEWKDTNKFKEDATTPDWNAQEGEAGYIKNKPFGEIVYAYSEQPVSNDVLQQFRIDFYEWEQFEFSMEDDPENPTMSTGFRKPIMSEFVTIIHNVYNGDNTFEYFGPYREGMSIEFVDHGTLHFFNEWDDTLGCNVLVAKFDTPVNGVPELSEECEMYYVTYDDYMTVKKLSTDYIPNTVLKTTPQTLSNADKNQVKANLGISTPDWNAQKGEAGYIENKPFSTKINTTVYEFTNGEGVQDNDNMNIHVVDEDGNPFDIICFRTPYDFIKIHDGDTYDYENSPLKTNRRGVHIIRVKYTNGWLDITLDNIDYNNYLVDWFNYDCYVGPYAANNNLIEIPHYYIPDTIIKTTPQSLSDTAKNQALTNLGIKIKADGTLYIEQ